MKLLIVIVMCSIMSSGCWWSFKAPTNQLILEVPEELMQEPELLKTL